MLFSRSTRTFLGSGPGGVRYASDFISKRTVRGGVNTMSRFYAVESTPTSTGSKSDHRLPLKPSEIAPFVRSLAVRSERWSRRRIEVHAGAGEGSARREGKIDRDRRRRSVARSARGRPLYQSGSRKQRQDGDVYRVARTEAGGSVGRSAVAHAGSEFRPGRSSADSGRQSGLTPLRRNSTCAARSRKRRCASAWASTRTILPKFASGWFRKPIRSKPGATLPPMTAL